MTQPWFLHQFAGTAAVARIELKKIDDLLKQLEGPLAITAYAMKGDAFGASLHMWIDAGSTGAIDPDPPRRMRWRR